MYVELLLVVGEVVRVERLHSSNVLSTYDRIISFKYAAVASHCAFSSAFLRRYSPSAQAKVPLASPRVKAEIARFNASSDLQPPGS